MKNFLKKIFSNMQKDFDADFDTTFNKMEGVPFDQYMENLKEKEKENTKTHKYHDYILKEAKRTGKSAAQIEHEKKYRK